MLSFNNIPDDIHKLIIENLLSNNVSIQSSFLENLHLLTICRKWRELALPMVFKDAYVTYGEHVNMSTAISQCSRETVTELQDVKILTNLNLLHAVGCSNAVRHVGITLYYLRNPSPALEHVARLLESSLASQKTKSLTLTMRPNYYLCDMNDILPNSYSSQAATLSKDIAKLMPGIKRLTIYANTLNSMARVLCNQLAEQYADQLEYLKSSYAIEVTNGCVFKSLKYVNINMDSAPNYQVPAMHTKHLKFLKLYNGSNNHSWDSFIFAQNPLNIEFPNLEQLKLFYTRSLGNSLSMTAFNETLPKIVFPKLKSLSVSDFYYCCPILERIELPNYVDCIDISGTGSMYERFKCITLPMCGNIELQTMRNESNTDTIKYMEYIFNRATPCKNLTMTINGDMQGCFVNSIACSALTHIRLSLPTSVSTLILLVERLPNMTKLELSHIMLNDAYEATALPEYSQHQRQQIVSFNFKLCSLSLYKEGNSNKWMIPVILYMLFRLPNLKELYAPQVSANIVNERLDQYRDLYPQISHVELKLASPSNETGSRCLF